MGYKAAIQVLQEADLLKAKLRSTCDLLNDSDVWTNQQLLQTIYHQVLVLDLEYALDKKVEQDLWTLGFKNHISALQELSKDKKNPRRHDSQALLSWCLEGASGFYLTLLQELCMTFDLDLSFRRPGSVYGQTKATNYCETVVLPQSSSCLYICQYCLVHLGDIARYRNQRHQAENFYKQAILVSPTSGQPYNQLALLEASQGSKLSTVFHYVRAIAVKNPFPASATNLSTTLSSAIDKDEPITEIQTKMCAVKLTRLFLHVHGVLNNASHLNEAEIGVKSMNATLTPLVATQSLTTDKLIKMTAINMYALWHISGINVMKTDEFTEDEIKVRELVLDLIAGSLSAFLLPIYTLKNDETLLNYYALPAIKLICSWIEKWPSVLGESVFTNRLQIWPSFCKLLNNLQTHIKDFDCGPYQKKPLPEEKELQGFLPLSESFKDLDFKSDRLQSDYDYERYLRASRLITFGLWLTTYEVNNSKLIISKPNEDNSVVVFEPGCIQPDPTDQLLELMKSVNVSDVVENVKTKVPVEKRTGILKPQGSLEKSREEREQNNHASEQNSDYGSNLISVKLEQNKMKRVKQNVALQSIFKKMEENKQVTFSEETSDKEIEKPKQKPSIKLPMPQINQAYRTQTFSQNHPALTNNLHQEFFNSTFQNHQNIPPEIKPPKNIFYPTGEAKSNMLQNIQYSSMPPVPVRMMPNTNTNSSFLNNSNFTPNSGFPSNFPPNLNNSNFANNPIDKPRAHLPMPIANVPFRAGPWMNDDRPKPGANWWPNQSGETFQQRDNYHVNMPFANNLSFPQANNLPLNIDFNAPQPNQSAVYNPWGNIQRNAVGNGTFGASNQGISMRQAMLNETKHMGPMGSNGNDIPNCAENIQQSNTPGYSLFDTNWPPSLSHLRGADNSPQMPMGNIPHQSLFSGPSQSSLMKLLEQQNQYRKTDK